MKPSKSTKIQDTKLTLTELPWVPQDLAESLSRIVSFLRQSFGAEVSWIGLYGSWQRGDTELTSDVDLVVFLNHGLVWFNEIDGIVSHSDARKDRFHWHTVAQKANMYRLDSRIYSIAVVTQEMLDYYRSRGPIHLQNWAHAIKNSYILWGNRV